MAEALQRLGPGPASAAPGRPMAGRGGLLRSVPALTLLLFLGPVGAGLIGTWLPAWLFRERRALRSA